MTIGRMSRDRGSSFDWREIVCDSEAAAKAEARRQQLAEDPEEVEWIYLRNKSSAWVARRTPRHLELPPEPWWSRVLEALPWSL